MKFSTLVQGTLATKAITLPFNGKEHPLAVRPLNGMEEGEALAGALAYAKLKGVANPAVGDRLYDLGLMVSTLAIGCVQADDPTQPFFDGGAEQILKHLDADRIAYLFELHQAWQDECGVRSTRISRDEFIVKVMEVANAKADEDPLALLRPATRRAFERTLASLYIASPQDRSSSMPDSEASTKSAPPPSSADDAPQT